MTPADFKAIRQTLGLSARRFAALIGYADDRTIRRIEAGESAVSGTTTKLLTYIMQGHLDETMREAIPEHLVCTPAREIQGREFVMRMYAPRFLASVTEAPIQGLESIALAGGAEHLSIVMWIDEPFEADVDGLLRRAATDFEIYTQDSF